MVRSSESKIYAKLANVPLRLSEIEDRFRAYSGQGLRLPTKARSKRQFPKRKSRDADFKSTRSLNPGRQLRKRKSRAIGPPILRHTAVGNRSEHVSDRG